MMKNYISIIIFSISLFFLAIAIIFSTVLIIISKDYASSLEQEVVYIQYDGLSPLEIDNVKGIIDSLNPLYLKGHKSITITDDIKKHQAKEGVPYNKSVGGFNKGREIYIQNFKNLEWMKNVICHEILHSYIRSGEIAHEVVYDLADKGVCYE